MSTGIESFYSSPPFQQYFKTSRQSLILKANPPYFTILAASDDYLATTHRQRAGLLGKGLFEAFPGSATDAGEQGGLAVSLHRVIQTQKPDQIPVFKYEIPIVETGEKSTFLWSSMHEPVPDAAGNVVYIITTTTNITGQTLQEQTLEKEQAINKGLKTLNEQLTTSNTNLHAARQSLQGLNNQLQEQVGHSTKALSDSEARLKGIFEQAPLGFCVLEGPELIIAYANDRMLELWNKTPDIIGRQHAHIRTGPGDEAFLKILNDVYTTGVLYSGNEVEAYTDEANEHVWGYFSFVYQPIKNEAAETTGILVIVDDVTEVVLSRKESARVNEQLRMAVEAANLGSWYIHPKTRHLEYNPALARIFGYEGTTPMTYEQAIGQVSEKYREEIVQAIDKAITHGGNYEFTYSQRRFNDGKLIWLRSLGRISPDETGAYTLFSGVVMDITQQKKEEERKNDFIGMVSHELKTPLTSMMAYTQILQAKAESNGDSFTAGMLRKAHQQVKRMTALINGFLNLSRLESGKIQIHKSTFDLDGLLQEMMEDAADTQPRHTILYQPCTPLTLYADRDKIGSVLSNLLSNAIKFSRFDNREVKVTCTIPDGMVRISVTDKGIGVHPDDQQQIFERYHRVNSDASISGFGIGLYLCAEIVALHGGHIGMESTPEKGSTFWFSLPLK